MKQGQMQTDGLLSDERNDDMTDSWMKVIDDLSPMEKSQKMKTP